MRSPPPPVRVLRLLLIGFGDCADGDRDRGQFIKAGAVLVFELEILEVKGDHKAKPEL